MPDDQVLFLSDIFPTGWMAAESTEIEERDTVAIWGCGPVGQFAIESTWRMGAARIIAIDQVPERLEISGGNRNSFDMAVLDRCCGSILCAPSLWPP